jgi:hypothetical protein
LFFDIFYYIGFAFWSLELNSVHMPVIQAKIPATGFRTEQGKKKGRLRRPRSITGFP